MKLAEEIEQLQEELIPQLPDEALETLQESTQELAETGIAEQALGKGDSVPLFTLPDAEGNSWSLNEALNNGPAILSFYRGGW